MQSLDWGEEGSLDQHFWDISGHLCEFCSLLLYWGLDIVSLKY
jgi:hypothetical protein